MIHQQALICFCCPLGESSHTVHFYLLVPHSLIVLFVGKVTVTSGTVTVFFAAAHGVLLNLCSLNMVMRALFLGRLLEGLVQNNWPCDASSQVSICLNKSIPGCRPSGLCCFVPRSLLSPFPVSHPQLLSSLFIHSSTGTFCL